MQLPHAVRRPFFIEELHKLIWLGSAKLSPQARHYYEMFSLLSELQGVSMADITGGEIYKEDFAYLLACSRFRSESANKWSNSDGGVVRR